MAPPPVEARALALLLALAGCAEDPPVPMTPLDAVVDGCVAWSPAGKCEHTPGTTLRVWHPGSPPGAVAVDGDAVPAESVEVDVGYRLVVTLPEDGRTLAVTSGTRRFELALSPVATSTPTDPRRRRVKARFQTGRNLLRAGELEAGYAAVVAAGEAARAIGDDHVARDAMLLAVFQDAVVRGDLVSAERLVTSAPRPSQADGRGRLLLAYHEGVVASRVLDARGALDALERAERCARRVDSPFIVYAVQEQARVMIDFGAARGAAKALERLLTERTSDMPACMWATVATTAGWARISARPRFELSEARSLFSRAHTVFVEDCPRRADANNLLVNLALVAGTDSPETWLDRISGPEQPEARMWRHAIEAGLHRDAGRLKRAQNEYRVLLDEARRQNHEALQWQAELGLGQVARAEGRQSEAIEHFRRAEQVILHQSQLVPVNQGRQFLLEQRAESSRRLVDALLETGAPAAALDAARHARRRSVRALAVRDALEVLPDTRRPGFTKRLSAYRAAKRALEAEQARAWQVPAEQRRQFEAGLAAQRAEVGRALDAAIAFLGQASGSETLPPIPDDAVLLMPFALEADRGVIFAATRKRVTAHRYAGSIEASDWQRALRKVGHTTGPVLVLSDPRTASGVETLPGPGASELVTRSPVYFGLDLGPGHTTTTSAALVIFDPRGDLADARTEGREVAAVLARTRRLRTLGPGDATPARVRAALEHVGLLHFAGHGKFAGDEGWQSQLLLTDGALDLGDLATLSAPPRWAVLSGCETARTQGGTSSAGLGLAQALLAAGTELAVATRVPVPSRDARIFSGALYGALGRGVDLPRAFVAARAHLTAEGMDGTPFVLLSR